MSRTPKRTSLSIAEVRYQLSLCVKKEFFNINYFSLLKMVKEPLVSVVIANWNGKDYLEECLESLKKQTYPFLEIIVVDNGSSDGSREFIKANFPKIEVIKNKTNRGFAQANNLGIITARGEYVATLNNDTVAEPDWIENLMEVAQKRKDIAMFASKILSYHQRGIIDSCGIILYLDGIGRCRGYLERDGKKFDQEEEVLMPTACAALYRKDILIQAGLFDEDYFAYCEDIDLGLRIRMLGLVCLYVPRAKVYHHLSATGNQNLPFKLYVGERNRLWTLIKDFPVSFIIFSPVYTLTRYLLYICATLKRIAPYKNFCKIEWVLRISLVLFKVYWATLINLPRLLKKRTLLMQGKKVSYRQMRDLLKRYELRIRELILITT